jgi:spore coat protein CotH
MKRRTYLASLATLTASAGCLGGTAATNNSSSQQMQKKVSVSNISTEGAPKGLDLNVEVDDATITESSTARVSLKYMNTGENTLTLNINPDAPDPVSSG